MNGRLGSLVASGEITGKSLELVLLHFPEGLVGEKAAPRRSREAREVRRLRPAQDRRNGAAPSEIARREEVRIPHARRRTRTRGGAGCRRRADRRRFRVEQISHREKEARDPVRLARRIRCRPRRGSHSRHRPRPRHRRIAEFRARSDQRAFEQADAAHARRERRGHGQGSRPRRSKFSTSAKSPS